MIINVYIYILICTHICTYTYRYTYQKHTKNDKTFIKDILKTYIKHT